MIPSPTSAAQQAILAEFEAQNDWLLTLITDPRGDRYFLDKSAAVRDREFREQLARTAAFLDFAGHPERRFPSIHVAGTSGKGSVTAMIAAILTAAGQRTGYHVSPYLQTPVEKLVVDGRYIRPSAFNELAREFRALYARWVVQGGDLRYGEAWVALTFLWLAGQQLDWAVVETGMGGRYDPTNVLPARLAVITNVDYDHVKALGPGLAEIARHKAGIIKPGGLALTAATDPLVRAVLADEAAAQGAELYGLGEHFDYTVHETGPAGSRLTVDTLWGRFDDLFVGSPGSFQAVNAATAAAAVALLAAHESLPDVAGALRMGLAEFRFPGRLELVQERPLVILDGAHNPAKMRALAASLPLIAPDRRVTVVLGVLVSKEAVDVVAALAPIANQFILTEPAVFGKPALPAAELAEIVRDVAPETAVAVIPDIPAAIEHGLAVADPADLLLITGSLYLVGQARERWYPSRQLLLGLESGTAWPHRG